MDSCHHQVASSLLENRDSLCIYTFAAKRENIKRKREIVTKSCVIWTGLTERHTPTSVSDEWYFRFPSTFADRILKCLINRIMLPQRLSFCYCFFFLSVCLFVCLFFMGGLQLGTIAVRSVWPLNDILKGTTAPCKNEPWCNGNETVLYTTQISSAEASPSDAL